MASAGGWGGGVRGGKEVESWWGILISSIDNGDIRHWQPRPLNPISEKICRTKSCYSDIKRVPISTSESIPTFNIKFFSDCPSLDTNINISTIQTNYIPTFHLTTIAVPLCYNNYGFQFSKSLWNWIWDNILKSDIMSDSALQSDIGGSDIRLSPILGITNTGMCAHLCSWSGNFTTRSEFGSGFFNVPGTF